MAWICGWSWGVTMYKLITIKQIKSSLHSSWARPLMCVWFLNYLLSWGGSRVKINAGHLLSIWQHWNSPWTGWDSVVWSLSIIVQFSRERLKKALSKQQPIDCIHTLDMIWARVQSKNSYMCTHNCWLALKEHFLGRARRFMKPLGFDLLSLHLFLSSWISVEIWIRSWILVLKLFYIRSQLQIYTFILIRRHFCRNISAT